MKKNNLAIIISLIVILISGILLFNYKSFGNPSNKIPSQNSHKEPINIEEKEEDAQNIIIDNNKVNVPLYSENLELPINGATGYTSIKMYLLNDKGEAIRELDAGTPFTILAENNEYFKVSLQDNTIGLLEHKYCLINLPDVIPSIVYDNTNSYRSIFKSNGEDLPDITNMALYNAKTYNERLQRHEFLMPVLYGMAKKICQVQQNALKNGESLVIYEAFRPYEVQMKVSASLETLMNSNEEVYKLINTAPWSKGWFIATTLSNHQRGFAIDTSLVKITKSSTYKVGKYEIFNIDEYEEYDMPTKMHELSSKAATFTTPVSSSSKTAFRNAKYADTMNEPAIKLQNYCIDNGLSPLSSEWWHFNDLDCKDATDNNKSNGRYYITECLSKIPN